MRHNSFIPIIVAIQLCFLLLMPCTVNALKNKIIANDTTTLPTLYEYYTGDGISAGLSANKSYFTLNHLNITLYSGAVHYFRVPKPYWRDRLRKVRAAGLNAVETYIPWNLHEPENGRWDFGTGGSDMEEFLDIREYLRIAQQEDLLVILRPGPFICSEWEFGGLPSWVLRKREIKIRTSDPIYMNYVRRYFNVLLPILAEFQFTKGGPVVAFQVENEYGSTEIPNIFTPDKLYLEQLRSLYISNGIVELLVTSDSPADHGTAGTLPGVFLQTANFASDPKRQFETLKKLQPNTPMMAMEFWTGWFDHWSERHNTRDDNSFYAVLEQILAYPASVNMYMFHGGTNWGFLNGANIGNGATDNSGLQPTTTSYDYDSPLSENGDYTLKYVMVKELIKKYNKINTRIPETPTITKRKKYTNITIQGQILLDDIIDGISPRFLALNVLPMEMLPINNLSGQSYGYIVYRKRNLEIPAEGVLKILGHVCDTVLVMVDGYPLTKPLENLADLNGFGFWRSPNSTLTLTTRNLSDVTLDLVVENWGRNNFGRLDQFNQYKGLWQGNVLLDETPLDNWEIIPLEFRRGWTDTLNEKWHRPIDRWAPGPALYRAVLDVGDDVQDTFINMSDWCKGIVVVNGFVLGRYARIGPQQTLYLPAPFLRKGRNEIVVFEHYVPASIISFSDKQIYSTAT